MSEWPLAAARLSPRLCLPQTQRAIVGRRHKAAVGQRHGAIHPAPMSFEGLNALGMPHVPQTQCGIVGPGQKATAG